MVGQNILMELLEGDKVQLYVYTSSGISDHKNSHYTQFIGCLLRPSVETLAGIMRKLGSTDALDDDVSIADGETSVRGGVVKNGEMGPRNRRGGSKNRVMSPPPPANNNNAATTTASVESTTSTIKEEEEVVLAVQNGEKNPPQRGDSTHQHQNGENNPQNGILHDEKPQQSYLALTKLGMGKKQEENNNKPKQDATKNGKPTRKSMAEMASSTLKGLTTKM